MSMEELENELENGIRIEHERLGGSVEVIAFYDKESHRLQLTVGTFVVYLTPEETAFYLSHMVVWHNKGAER